MTTLTIVANIVVNEDKIELVKLVLYRYMAQLGTQNLRTSLVLVP